MLFIWHLLPIWSTLPQIKCKNAGFAPAFSFIIYFLPDVCLPIQTHSYVSDVRPVYAVAP